MGTKARNYTGKTLKRLFALSGNQCAFPGCKKVLVNSSNAKDSNICHIEAASEGGERYNASMTDSQRADYPNLILFCIQHHDETNDVNKYTVGILLDIKLKHESEFVIHKINSNPSMLLNAINAIANIQLDNTLEADNLNPPNPKTKIAHNCIKRNVTLIQEYKVYFQKINSLYDELELQGSIKKERLLNNIKIIYTQIKGRYVLDSPDPLEIIRENSDNIFDDVYDELDSKMRDSHAWEEDVQLGIRLIMVDAFIRCKILEEPPKL